jgi:UDP-2,4-diacetamido-2,4,6-trideoxy-beta-L-altropyranose hydrolase
MKVAFRTDASLKIGTGHVMRCLTLAAALRERSAECVFICRAHPGNLLELIRGKGFVALALPEDDPHVQPRYSPDFSFPPHAAWLGADWQGDADATLALLKRQLPDWLVVDHYSLDARWEKSLRSACRSILVIDDLADRSHDCDLLLDQNLGRVAADYDSLVPTGCKRLIGAQYALLRPQFAALREYSLARRTKPELKRLLITMGGVDKDNVTGKVLNVLKASPLPGDCTISIVMGPYAPWLEEVRNLAVLLPWKTEVLVNVADMANLMADSDLAIGAAGATAWERCCVGLPSIVVCLAENQRSGAAALRKSGGAVVLEDGESISRELLGIIVHSMVTANLQALQIACSLVADGLGTCRVIDELVMFDA